MRIWLAAMPLVLGLAACGADGEPIQPTMNMGIGVGSGGVHGYGGVGLHRGPISVFLGI